MTTSLSQFNKSIHEFVDDIIKMKIMNKEAFKLKRYVDITRVNARSIIRNFQKFILRDIFVSNIIKNNTDFFLNHNIREELNITDESTGDLIDQIKDLVNNLVIADDTVKINKTFNWLKILCYHAYNDLGIDANQKFNLLMTEKGLNIE